VLLPDWLAAFNGVDLDRINAGAKSALKILRQRACDKSTRVVATRVCTFSAIFARQ
jgi:hypothetical protein